MSQYFPIPTLYYLHPYLPFFSASVCYGSITCLDYSSVQKFCHFLSWTYIMMNISNPECFSMFMDFITYGKWLELRKRWKTAHKYILV